jgi:hypothetical protein
LAVAAAAWLLHVPLAPVGCAVVGLALASFSVSFDLGGYFIARLPKRVRFGLHGTVALLVGVTAIAWGFAAYSDGSLPARPGAAFSMLATAPLWRFFLPAESVIGVAESICNGGRLVVQLGSALALAAVFVAFYVCRAYRSPSAPDRTSLRTG